jgi:cobaltochelatase CobN
MVMKEEDRSARVQAPLRPKMPVLSAIDILWPAALFLLLLIGWRRREFARPGPAPVLQVSG